jgi:PKD domain
MWFHRSEEYAMRLNIAVAVCGLIVLAGCGGGSSNTSSPSSSVKPPVANVGGPYTGTAGTAISFSGAGSSDPQGEALTYAWSFGDGATGTGVSPTHTYAVNGYPVSTYTVSLTVTNTSGLGTAASTTATIDAPAPLPDGSLTGVVSSATLNGTVPVAYAHVYLFAANTTGYGKPSVSLLSATQTGTSDAVGAYVTTAFNGTFNMSGDYSCTSGQQLYLYVLGGDAGTGQDALLGMMAAIGSCPSSTGPALFATVNEVSTIAAAYAFAGFATDATHVSSSGTALAQVGVANAFANAANLASLTTGAALAATPAGNETVPQTEIGTLANVLAGCINVGGTPCSTLLQTATADGTSTGTIPTDTATAAINIAHNPGANVATLYGLASTAVFTPALTAVPNDFTVALYFTGGGMYDPQRIAIDGSGNVWVADVYFPGGFGTGSVTKLSSSGSILSGASGYTGGGMDEPWGIAIDGSGNAWVANYAGSVTELSNSGSILSGTNGFPAGGLNPSRSIAIDGSGDAWIPAYVFPGNITELSSTGSVLSGANGFTGGDLADSSGIAIDGSGNAWVANSVFNNVTELSKSGTILSGANGFSGGGLYNPSAIAIDGSGNAWAANLYSNSITKLSNSGSILSGATGFTGGDLDSPVGIAIDGSGNAWIVNQFSNVNSGFGSITELSSSGSILSGANGFTSGGLDFPLSIAIDGSGNVWVGSSLYAVSELIGAAVPVVTPLAVGVKNNTLGTRP